MKSLTVKINKNEVLRYLGYAPKLYEDESADAAVDASRDGCCSDDESTVKYGDNDCMDGGGMGGGSMDADSKSSSGMDGCIVGYEIDVTVEKQIDECIAKIFQSAEAKYIYRVLPLKKTENGILIEGTSALLTGSDAEKLLKECHSCIIMAATIGIKADMLINRAQVSDMSKAVILDCCASSAVESICEQVNDELKAEYEGRGLFLTDRYSPGYGDMPLELQTDLCRILETDKRIGVSVNAGLTLSPVKSVTAIIGISDVPSGRIDYSCDACRLKDTCRLRAAGLYCGS